MNTQQTLLILGITLFGLVVGYVGYLLTLVADRVLSELDHIATLSAQEPSSLTEAHRRRAEAAVENLRESERWFNDQVERNTATIDTLRSALADVLLSNDEYQEELKDLQELVVELRAVCDCEGRAETVRVLTEALESRDETVSDLEYQLSNALQQVNDQDV